MLEHQRLTKTDLAIRISEIEYLLLQVAIWLNYSLSKINPQNNPIQCNGMSLRYVSWTFWCWNRILFLVIVWVSNLGLSIQKMPCVKCCWWRTVETGNFIGDLPYFAPKGDKFANEHRMNINLHPENFLLPFDVKFKNQQCIPIIFMTNWSFSVVLSRIGSLSQVRVNMHRSWPTDWCNWHRLNQHFCFQASN